MIIMNGKEISDSIRTNIKKELVKLNYTRKPNLSVILAGDNDASKTYVRFKERACDEIGFTSNTYLYDSNVDEDTILNKIKDLNNDVTVDAILVQLPLPDHINTIKIIDTINPKKDVDGFHTTNVGLVNTGNSDGLVPCTPQGIVKILDYYNISVEGRTVCIVGRSSIVGRPITELMLNMDATVINCNVFEKNLKTYTSIADILIVATGNDRLITADMVKDGAVVIDVGINRVNGKLVGDVDFESVKDKVSYITPVPGGVGPVTIAMLLQNTFTIFKDRQKGL